MELNPGPQSNILDYLGESKSNDKCPHNQRDEEEATRIRGVIEWHGAATSQEIPRVTRSWKKQSKIHPSTFIGTET